MNCLPRKSPSTALTVSCAVTVNARDFTASGAWNFSNASRATNVPVDIALADNQATAEMKCGEGAARFHEFWQNAQVVPGALALAAVTPKREFGGSGKPEPIAFATQFGSGRGFTLLLGHNAKAMESDGFKTLLQRGTEWAVTGKISTDKSPTKKSK